MNDFDFDGIEWLEMFVCGFCGGVVVVSYDCEFFVCCVM